MFHYNSNNYLKQDEKIKQLRDKDSMSEFSFFILRASNIEWVNIPYNIGLVYYTWFILVPTDSGAF